MRKLLMASAAILGASGGLAIAQTPAAPNQGQLAAPYGAGPASNNNNNAWGIANTPTGSAAAGPLSTIFAPNVDAVPAPGTVVIRLNGRIEVDLAATYSSFDRGVNNAGAPTGYKVNPLGVGSYARLYPGVDGKAANGLRYGASMELRENFNSGVFTGSQTTPVAATATATSPSTNTSAQTVYVRRAFTYLASDKVGIVRFGQGDGVISLFDNCIFSSQCWDAGVGNFSGGGNQSQSAQGAFGIPFVFLAGAGAEYANNKIVYLTPQFFGFDFGVQYAPSMGNSLQSSGVGVGCTQASASCIGLTSGNDATRWYNQVGVGARYQQTFGAVDVKLYGFYETASKENLTTSAYATTNQARLGTAVGGVTSSAQNVHYDNLSFYKAAAAITAFNVTAAADFIGGSVNGQLSMRPTGGAPTHAVVTGLTYANGPITLGAEIELIDTQGDARLVNISQRHEYGVAFGGNYKLAPGVQLVGEYLYNHRHQGGYDFATGTLGNNTAVANNNGRFTRDAQGQAFLFSTVLTW